MTDFKQRFEDLKAMFTEQQLQDFLDDPDAFLAENLGSDPQVESAPVAVPPRMGAGPRRGRKKEDSVPKMVRNTFQKFENEDDLDVEKEATALDKKASDLMADMYGSLTPWRKCQVARHPDRPHCLDYIDALFTEYTPLQGDRNFADDDMAHGR